MAYRGERLRKNGGSRAEWLARFKKGAFINRKQRGPQVPLELEWADAISESQWKVYAGAMDAIRSAGVPFMLGGGFALAAFTGRWRDTKDIDFYIRPGDRDK